MASGTTCRISDGAPVDWHEAVAAWADAGRPVLEGVAGTYGAYLTYQGLAEKVQVKAGIQTGVPFRHWIGQVLGAIASQPRPEDEPLLTSLVVRADGTIGDGYAIPVKERDGSIEGDLDMHAAAERQRCYAHFGAEMPPGGGRPELTRQVAERRRRASRSSAPPRRPVCPTCFLELPATGQCDGCGE